MQQKNTSNNFLSRYTNAAEVVYTYFLNAHVSVCIINLFPEAVGGSFICSASFPVCCLKVAFFFKLLYLTEVLSRASNSLF